MIRLLVGNRSGKTGQFSIFQVYSAVMKKEGKRKIR